MQNERKVEFMKTNKEYVVPSFSVMLVGVSDVITTSDEDNVGNDPFPPKDGE